VLEAKEAFSFMDLRHSTQVSFGPGPSVSDVHH
jgi:hypothetical protein